METIQLPITKTILITVALSLLTLSSQAQFFYDGFESADMSSSNADGFKWGNNNRTSIVTMDPQDGPVAVWNNGSIYNISADQTKDWTAKNGDYCLRFRYPAGESWAEQRFEIGKAYPEIWMSFWLKVPINFTHSSASPNNQKLFRLWMDAYSGGEGSKVGMSFRGNGQGGSNFFAKINGGGDIGSVPFITVPDDQGKWMKLIVHVKSETQPDAQDGVMEVWRKWEDEPNYSKTHNFENQPIKLDSTVAGFASGYLMGWANAPYSKDTEFLIDDFTLSTTSLIDSTTTEIQKTTKTGTINVYPNPASDYVTISDLSQKGQTTIVLNNTLGQQVREVMNFTGKTSIQINTADLSEGIYLLTVITNNQRFTTKIIK